MKAAVYHGLGDMRVEECQEPRTGTGDTVAVVGAGPSGILHADLARAAGRFSASASSHDNALIAAIPRSKKQGYLVNKTRPQCFCGRCFSCRSLL